MSSYCYSQNCIQNCCNVDGICPTSYGSYYQMNCYHYYNSYSYSYIWSYWWFYFVIALSSLLCLSIIIATIVACVKRRRKY